LKYFDTREEKNVLVMWILDKIISIFGFAPENLYQLHLREICLIMITVLRFIEFKRRISGMQN
jgi:hypothetical protein